MVDIPFKGFVGLLPLEILASGLEGSTPSVSGTLGSDFREYSGRRLLSLFHLVVCLATGLLSSASTIV